MKKETDININREKQFSNTLKELVEEAGLKGNIISKERVKEAYAQVGLSEEQLDMVFDYLKKKHIGIGEAPKDEDYLEPEELDYLERYINELNELPEFTPEEKESCTLLAMKGESAARSRLVEMFLPEVIEIAKLYAGQGVFLEDLIGEGNMALASGVSLLGAMETAEEAQGMLARLIMEGMEAFICENSDIKEENDKILQHVNLVADKARELSEELRRKVTVEELAQESGLSRDFIEEALKFSGYNIDTIGDA